MMASWVCGAALFLALMQAAPPAPRATVSAQTFLGTWVGTQAWAIDSPPPGANPEQPVSITIEMVNGKLTGTMTPFLGGQDGATFLDARIVGDELVAAAMVGQPPAGAGGRGTSAPAPIVEEEPGTVTIVKGKARTTQPWKDTVKVRFAFKNDGLDLKGTADLMVNDVKWLKFNYTLSKKRSRY